MKTDITSNLANLVNLLGEYDNESNAYTPNSDRLDQIACNVEDLITNSLRHEFQRLIELS